MTQILPEHSQNWKSIDRGGRWLGQALPQRGRCRRGRGSAAGLPPGARRVRAARGGASRPSQGGAALGVCRSSEAQDDGGGAGRRRRCWVGAAALGGRGSREDRGTALARTAAALGGRASHEDRPGLRGFRNIGFQLGRLGRLFFLIYVMLVADPRIFAEHPKMRTRHIKLCRVPYKSTRQSF